jgi:hypothetical protein
MSNGEDLTYENETYKIEEAKKEADNLMMNKVAMYEEKLTRLKGDINRLVEENSNYEIISKSHKELNGQLQKEVNELKEDNKKLAKQVEEKDRLNQLRKAGL